MAQSESLYSELAGNHESVQVTHVESPVLFFCRLVSDEERVTTLEDNIAQYITSSKPTIPNVNALNGPNKLILVYSIIRDRWCRGRVISYQRNQDLNPINAKVCFIDYGSIEVVLWNEKYVRISSPEIDGFNDGRGFCFPCALGNIKPFDDSKPAEMLHWGSYANFLIEKETKNRNFVLQVSNSAISSCMTPAHKNIVICDLLPLCPRQGDAFGRGRPLFLGDSSFGNETQAPISQVESIPLTSYLVSSNVARYIDGDDCEQQSDNEKENHFIATH